MQPHRKPRAKDGKRSLAWFIQGKLCRGWIVQDQFVPRITGRTHDQSLDLSRDGVCRVVDPGVAENMDQNVNVNRSVGFQKTAIDRPDAFVWRDDLQGRQIAFLESDRARVNDRFSL